MYQQFRTFPTPLFTFPEQPNSILIVFGTIHLRKQQGLYLDSKNTRIKISIYYLNIMPSGINVMISLRSDVSERPHRFHPNDTQLQLPDSQSIKGRFSEYETAVRSCKHCSFSFRTDLNDTKTDEYCSKGISFPN